MVDYEEVRIARRTTRLIRDSGMDFSFLNVMVVIFVIALIIAGVGSIFK